MAKSKDEIQQVRDLVDGLIGRKAYAEIARGLGISPESFSDRLRRGSLRVVELQKIAAMMNKEIVYEEKI